MTSKILKAKCKFCGKEVYSLYKKQLTYNHKLHEDKCERKIKAEQNGEDKTSPESDKEKK